MWLASTGQEMPYTRATPSVQRPVSSQGERLIHFAHVKLPDLGMDQQTGNVRHDLREFAVRDDCDSFDLLMVLGDEFQMCRKRVEAVPARE